MKKTKLAEIVILGNNGEPVFAFKVPDCGIGLRVETHGIDMLAVWKDRR